MEKFTAYLDDTTIAQLKADAARNGRTVAGTVRWIVERYLAEERREPGEGR